MTTKKQRDTVMDLGPFRMRYATDAASKALRCPACIAAEVGQ